MTTSAKIAQNQDRPKHRMEGVVVDMFAAPPLSEELLAIYNFWQEESQFYLKALFYFI